MSFCALNADACSQPLKAAVPDCRGFSTGADYIHDVCFPQPVEAGVLDCRGFSTAFPRDSQQANDFYLYAHELVFRSGRPNFVVSRLPVPSSLKINTWRTLLYDYDDQMICDFLEFGWPVGFTGDTVPIFDARTHRGALNFATQVSEHLQREVSLGRVAGPFTDPPFGGGFVTSPLNTVPKRDSEERRVIVDLSWPKGGSVNDGIPCDSFLGDPFVTCYPTIDDIVEAIVQFGPGCFLYKRDLRQAYRQFPVDPGDYRLLGYIWNGHYYFDTVLTMGLRSAAQACQRATSAVAWIHRQQGKVLFNYLDDFIGVSEASSATSDFEQLGTLLSSLGLIESVSKACPPSSLMLCLGVMVDTNSFTLSVSPERLAELELLLHDWRNRKTARKRELQSLVGKLVFVSKCVRRSRVFISRLLSLLRTVQYNHLHVNLTAEFRKDIIWWCHFLREYNGVSMIKTTSWSSPGEVFSTDACLIPRLWPLCKRIYDRHYKLLIAQGHIVI
ncbi:uncharacterized protein LOC116621133 isoform X1 [Nematostella vectensis]|uniref:uncharacterized protein LOC116621133 isoform X1 n=1 Tax=Nematostella vectensis TaxID=45351 RepID=UPI0020777FFB|nr:uncharacterized protein LOC116621133 isoform X1 [Nematostella vectensis]